MPSTVRKVCDIQDELYGILPISKSMLIRSHIHERRWDDAEDRLSFEMDELYKRIQQLKEARKIIRRIKR